MERIIKFRAWNPDNGYMEYEPIALWSDYTFSNGKLVTVHGPDGEEWTEPSHHSLMQFIGLHSQNGEEVYEGDVVKNERGEVGQIVFNNGSFVSQYLPPHNWDVMEPCDGLLDRQTVIGNIYENPELMEAKHGKA